MTMSTEEKIAHFMREDADEAAAEIARLTAQVEDLQRRLERYRDLEALRTESTQSAEQFLGAYQWVWKMDMRDAL